MGKRITLVEVERVFTGEIGVAVNLRNDRRQLTQSLLPPLGPETGSR